MADPRRRKRLAVALIFAGVAGWIVGSWWMRSLLGVPGPVGQWTTWTWPADPDPSLSILGPFTGGAGMFVLAMLLMFGVALIGAWQRPLLPRLGDD
jgi:hypothetical protein